jgi:pimeloyl-ACP methyl ester carboxylesterase
MLLCNFSSLLRKVSDVIIFDQRGTGYSKPFLTCPDISERFDEAYFDELLDIQDINRTQYETLDDLPLKFQEVIQEHFALSQQICFEESRSKGIDLHEFNTKNSAKDVDEIRKVFGFETWSVLGVSYGTHLALTYADSFSKHISSMILDSVLPSDINFFADTMTNQKESMEAFFEVCKTDRTCNDIYPDLEEDYLFISRYLNNYPITSNVKDSDGDNVVLTGSDIAKILWMFLYSSENREYLPLYITYLAYDIYDDNIDTELIDDLASIYEEEDEYSSDVMYFSIICQDFFPDINLIEQRTLELGEYKDSFGSSSKLYTEAICTPWKNSESQITHNYHSEVPTLILSGALDPITPTSWAKKVDEAIGTSHHVDIKYGNHGLYNEPCAKDIVREFLSDSSRKPNDSCKNRTQFTVYDPSKEAQSTMRKEMSPLKIKNRLIRW